MTRRVGIFLVGVLFACMCEAQSSQSNQAGAAAAPKTGPQQIDFGKGSAVPFSAVREEAKEPISLNSEPEFQLRLKNGGTVVISESDLETGKPNFQQRGLQFMALDTLQLKKGARIVTGGNDLVIFANKIVSEDGSIVAFTDADRTAKNATTVGGGGSPGVSGGTVTLIAINGIDGRLHVDLGGQNGGDGATGAQGANGANGAKGEDSESTPFGCAHGGGGGLPGSAGQKGATGGPAGNGGSGGSFFLYNVGDQPVPTAVWEYVANAGLAGRPGNGGLGGRGGHGGDGGNGGGFCGGGPPGANGQDGSQGDSGPVGINGGVGNSLVTNMEFELLIQKAKSIPLGAAQQ